MANQLIMHHLFNFVRSVPNGDIPIYFCFNVFSTKIISFDHFTYNTIELYKIKNNFNRNFIGIFC